MRSNQRYFVTYMRNLINIHIASVLIREANRVGFLEKLRNKYS